MPQITTMHLGASWGGGGLDSATTAWINAVIAAGGTVSGTQQTRVDTLIKALKTAPNGNQFTLWDRIYLYAGESITQQANISIVNPGATAAVPHNAMVLSAAGWTGDVSSAYIDTNYTSSAGSGAQNNQAVGGYMVSTADTNHAMFGTVDTGGGIYIVFQVNASAVDLNDASFPAYSLTGGGLYVFSRTGSTGFNAYKNAGAPTSLTATSNGVVNNKMFVCAAATNTGTPANWCSDPIRAFFIGQGLTTAQVGDFQAALNAYMIAWGVHAYGGGGTTWNPSDKASVTLSNGNLTMVTTATSYQCVRTISSQSTGKFYYEVQIVGSIVTQWLVGIANASALLTNFPGVDANAIGWNAGDGKVWLNSSNPSGSPIAAWSTNPNDVLSVAVDLTAKLFWGRVNAGNWNNSGTANPATGTGGISFSSINAGPYFPIVSAASTGDSGTANFGGSAYAQSVPAGFGNW